MIPMSRSRPPRPTVVPTRFEPEIVSVVLGKPRGDRRFRAFGAYECPSVTRFIGDSGNVRSPSHALGPLMRTGVGGDLFRAAPLSRRPGLPVMYPSALVPDREKRQRGRPP